MRRDDPEPARTEPADPADAADPAGTADRADPAELLTEATGLEPEQVVPWPVLWRQRMTSKVEGAGAYPWIVVTAALFGLFTVGFSITILAISLDRIAIELDTSRSTVIWVVTGPILLGAIVTPSAGKLADVFGARRVYLIAMATFGIFSGLSAISWSASSLIAFRVLGAAIGSATGPASIAIINRLFPRERRAQALGYWSLVAAGGPVVGVIVGGPVVEAVGWRPIFAAAVPLAAITVVVCAIVFPETERRRDVRFDVVGALLLAGGAAAFVIALNRGPELGWSSPAVVAGFVAAPVLLGSFVLYERRIVHQLIPMRYFRERNVAFPFANQFFMNFAYMGGFFLTPFLLRDVLGFGEAKIGVVSIARPLVFAIAGPVAGYLATRIGERINGIVGAGAIAASMLAFATVGPSTGEWFIVVALMLSGLGMGTAAPAMTAAVANAVAEVDLGVIGGAQQMVSQIGVVVGTQVMVTVQQSLTDPADPAAAYHAGYLVGAVGAVLGVAAALFVHNSHRRPAEVPAPDVLAAT